jgi:TonB family protein
VTTHVISATYTRFDRMSPTAAVLAVLLHVATALALWWISPLNHRTTAVADPAIEVTLEPPPPAPKSPPPPKPELETKPSPPPSMAKPPAATPKAPPAPLGLPPPSPTVAEKPQRAAPKPDPKPDLKSEAKSEPQQALAPPEATPPPATLENALPPLEAPPPPPTSKEIPKPPPRPVPARPKVHAAPAPQHPQLSPSPLTALQQRRTPTSPRATEPSATFVNPADRYNQNNIVEQYLWSVARKISQYRYHSNQANEQGTVVLRVVIRRDGHLLDVSIARSSGIVNLDRGLVEAARAASPYAALPTSLQGPQITFTLPFASVYRPQ